MTQKHFTNLFRKTIILFFIIIFCQINSLSAAAEADADIAWTQSEEGQLVIYTSAKRDGNWNKPKRLTGYGVNSLHPVLDGDGGENKWLSWTQFDNTGFKIGYARHDKNGWSIPETLETETENNIAPQILLNKDRQKVACIVWTGNNNDDDDIYFSQFNGKKWGKAEMVHPDNNAPDILPVLDFDMQNRMRIIWQRFTGSQYELVFSIYRGNQWSHPVLFENKKNNQKSIMATKDTLEAEEEAIVLPEFTQKAEDVYCRIYKGTHKKPPTTL